MIKGIKIKESDSFFNDMTALDLFDDEDPNVTIEKRKNLRYSVIYGKNGSGKTSISKAFFTAIKNLNAIMN